MFLSMVLTLALAGCKTAPTTPDKDQLIAQIERKFENPEAHYQLGKLSYAEGKLDAADYEYRTALGFDPVHYRAQAGVVKVATDQKQTERARIIAELYISQAAMSASASKRLGKAFQNEGLGEYALSCYYQASGLDSKDAEPFKLLGYYYLDNGDKIRAEENFRRSFELDSDQTDVSGELGRLGVIISTPRANSVNAPQPD